MQVDWGSSLCGFTGPKERGQEVTIQGKTEKQGWESVCTRGGGRKGRGGEEREGRGTKMYGLYRETQPLGSKVQDRTLARIEAMAGIPL